jgi:hypothetical protein
MRVSVKRVGNRVERWDFLRYKFGHNSLKTRIDGFYAMKWKTFVHSLAHRRRLLLLEQNQSRHWNHMLCLRPRPPRSPPRKLQCKPLSGQAI